MQGWNTEKHVTEPSEVWAARHVTETEHGDYHLIRFYRYKEI